MNLFGEEEERQFHQAIVAGFAKGQGEFDDLDFAAARADLVECLVRGNTAQLLLEGRLGIVVDHGVVKYRGLGERG